MISLSSVVFAIVASNAFAGGDGSNGRGQSLIGSPWQLEKFPHPRKEIAAPHKL